MSAQGVLAAGRDCLHDDKRRHARRKVIIPARMKASAGWSDVCIRDISARGLLVQAAAPPPRGAYVEIRRGAHIIIAKVAWSQERQFGVSSHDLLPVDAIIQNPQAGTFGRSVASEGQPVERRAQPRRSSAEAHARSRETSRMIQFGFILVLVLAALVTIFEMLSATFSGSLARVESALEGAPSSGRR